MFSPAPRGTAPSQDPQDLTMPFLFLFPIFILFCSTASFCGPRSIGPCPVGAFIPRPSPLSSSFLYLPSKENHPLEILLFQHNLFDFQSPKVCFLTLSPPGNCSPRSPQGHPNSRHRRWLFPGSSWAFAYSIPQPMYSPLLKYGSSSPPRPTSPPGKLPHCPWLKGFRSAMRASPIAHTRPALIPESECVHFAH